MLLTPPYPYELHGCCAACGGEPQPLTRVWGPDFFRYRCATCLPNEPMFPPREDEL